MGKNDNNQDLSFFEKVKLGKQTKEYKRWKRNNRIFSLIILIILLLLGNYYWKDHDYNSFLANALDNTTESENITNEEMVQAVTGDLKVYYLDVGQADSILVMDKDKTMLIDAGTNEMGDDVVNFLEDKGVEKIDYLIGTHPHEDHIGGLDDVIDNFDIGTIYMPKIQTNTKTFEDVLDSIEKKDLKVTAPKQGDEFKLDDAECEIMLANEDDNDSNLNLSSIVIRMTYGENSFLFMGDAEQDNEEEREWPQTDVLKVGHHGSRTATSKEFVEQVKPSIAIIEVAKKNSYNLPNDEPIENLENVGAKIYRTDEDGNILVTSDGKNLEVETNVK